MTRIAREHDVAQNDDSFRARFDHRRESRFVLIRALRLERLQLNAGRPRCRHYAHVFSVLRSRWVGHHGKARHAWHRVAKELHPLRGEVARKRGHAGDVSARVREARDEPALDRIVGAERHDDRNRRCRIVRGTNRYRRSGNNDVDVEAYELGGQRRQPIRLAVGQSLFECDIAANDIAARTKLRQQNARERHIPESSETEKAYTVQLGLRECGAPRGDKAANERADEFPPIDHRITPLHIESPYASTDGDIGSRKGHFVRIREYAPL